MGCIFFQGEGFRRKTLHEIKIAPHCHVYFKRKKKGKKRRRRQRRGKQGGEDQPLILFGFLFAKLLKETTNTTKLKTELIITTKYKNIFKSLHLSSTSMLAIIHFTCSYADRLTKTAVILVAYSTAKASVKCLTGHPGAMEKERWMTSKRLMCDALGRSSMMSARLQCAFQNEQAYVTYYHNLVVMKTFKSLSMRKFICYLKWHELCIMNSLWHNACWQSITHKTRSTIAGLKIIFIITSALGDSPFDLQISSIYDFQVSI